MILKNKILGGAIAAAFCGLFATSASAALRYDLRFADGTKSKLVAAGTAQALNLYGVIDQGNGSYADDSITGGFVNVYSSAVGGAHGITPGSGITGFTLGPAVFPGQSLVGSGGDLRTNPNFDIFAVEGNADNQAPAGSKDGVLDWGSDQSFFGSLAFNTPNQGLQVYTKDGATSNPSVNSAVKFAFSPPLVPGGAVGSASATIPNAWEVLLGTYTVQINNIGVGTTNFTPWIYHRVRTTSSAGTAADGMSYNQDGSAAVPGRATVRLQAIPNLFSGVSMIGIPEPSTFVMCGLAAIGSIFALRRKSKS